MTYKGNNDINEVKQHSIECGNCSDFGVVDFKSNRSEAGKHFRKLGWKYLLDWNGAFGWNWTCPSCLKKGKEKSK